MTNDDSDDSTNTVNRFNPAHHDRLAAGVAGSDTNSSSDDAYPTRIVPVGEGDTTVGLSGKETYWDRDTLKKAVEQGAFDGAKILKGSSGDGHKDMLSLADPDSIIGSVDSWRYEDGVGPVGEGPVLDEHMAKLIEHGLIEVSPDMWRELGDYDEDLEAYRVDQLTSVPYLTLVDRGAGNRTVIEPARAEALGFTEWEDESESAEPAESGRDTDNSEQDMTNKEELQEQLAAAKAELEQKEEAIENHEEQIQQLEESKSELESDLTEVKETVEEKDERIDTLESENKPLRQMLSERVADGAALSPEQVADSNLTNEELADSIVENDNLRDAVEDGDEKSAVELVSEQLAAAPALRGETSNDDDTTAGADGLDEEQLSAANDRAYELISGNDIMNSDFDQMSPREYVRQYKDIDPADYSSRQALRNAFKRKGGDA
ncbi:hypothetical protein [Halocatena halophila]|uniref:hypothetical protein n=1 Tax=Halocatena halophila TaxID=2814576 RepID=UPI002ED3E91A